MGRGAGTEILVSWDYIFSGKGYSLGEEKILVWEICQYFCQCRVCQFLSRENSDVITILLLTWPECFREAASQSLAELISETRTGNIPILSVTRYPTASLSLNEK